MAPACSLALGDSTHCPKLRRASLANLTSAERNSSCTAPVSPLKRSWLLAIRTSSHAVSRYHAVGKPSSPQLQLRRIDSSGFMSCLPGGDSSQTSRNRLIRPRAPVCCCPEHPGQTLSGILSDFQYGEIRGRICTSRAHCASIILFFPV